MNFVEMQRTENIATVTLSRGKVNALDPEIVAELRDTFKTLNDDKDVHAVIITGRGPFFSFGFDVPEFLSYERRRFEDFTHAFTSLYTEIHALDKAVVAALNGHSVAGGCMIANVCDYRIIAAGKAKVGLNEITFGAAVFSGSVEVIRALVGDRNAERVLLTGQLFGTEEARKIGLVDEVCPAEELPARALSVAQSYASREPATFRSIKRLLRTPILERMRAAEPRSLREFVDIWYSRETREQLKGVQIR